MTEAKTLAGAPMIVLTPEEFAALSGDADTRSDAALLAEARAADAGLPTLDDETVAAVLAGTLHPLTAWRKAHGLSMAELAARAEMRAANVSDIENGKIDPRYSTLRALADAMGMDVDDIMP